MNRLLIPNGGMPFQGDDIRWDQDGVREALRGAISFIAAQFTDENVALHGVSVSYDGTNATIGEGWVSINGEICYVPAQVVAVTSLSNSSLKIVETYDASGLEVFGDSVSRNTYAIRRAIASEGLTGDGDELVLSGFGRAENAIQFISQVLHGVGYDSGYSGLVNNVVTSRVSAWKTVQCRGYLTGVIPTGKFSATRVFTLNSAHWPSKQFSVLFCDELDDTHLIRAIFEDDGEVRFTSIAGGSDGQPFRVSITTSFFLD